MLYTSLLVRAGGGGEERTQKVDYEGALKIFDAIEGVEGPVKPRLILVSALDIRDPEKIPTHYVSFFSHFFLIFISEIKHRMKTISHIPIDYEKSSQHICIGSMKQTRIL